MKFTYYDIDKKNLFDFSKNYYTKFNLITLDSQVLDFKLTIKAENIYIWEPKKTLFKAISNTGFRYYIDRQTILNFAFIDINRENLSSVILNKNNIFDKYKLGYYYDLQ